MSDSPETTQVVVTESSPVARDDSNASDIPHADSLSALDKAPSTAMADTVSTQEPPETDVADKELVDVVTKDVPLQVAEDGLAGVLDSKVEGPTGTTLLATDAPAPIPPVQDTVVTKAEVAEDATVAKPTPVTVTEEEEARPEALSQEDKKEVASTLPTIAHEPAGANDTTQIDAEDRGVTDPKEHDTIHLTSTEEAAPTDTIPTATAIPELHSLDSDTALLSSKDAIPTSEIAEAKEDATIAGPEPTVQLVIPVDDVKPNFSGLEDGASQDELSSNQAENLPLQQGAIEGLLTDKDDQEPEILIEPEMTFAAPSSPILPASKSQPQEDVPAVPQEPEAVAAEPAADDKDEVKDEEKPSLESVDSTIPAQDEPVVDTTEDVIVKDEPTSVDAESKDEPVPEKIDAEEAAPVEEAIEAKPEESTRALDQDQPSVGIASDEIVEAAAPEPVPEEEPVKEQQPAEAVAEDIPAESPEPVKPAFDESTTVPEDVKPADALEVETDAVAAQEQPAVEETPEEPQPEVVEKSAIDIAATTLDEKAEETVATETDKVVEAAAAPVETEQVHVEEPVVEGEKESQEPVQVAVDEKTEPEPVKIEEVKAEKEPAPKPEEEEKPAEVEEPSKVEEPKAEEPTVEPEAVPETQEPAEAEKPQGEALKVKEAVGSAEPVPVEKSIEHEATEETEEQPASAHASKEASQLEEHEEKAADVKEVEQEPVKVEESAEKPAEPAQSAEVIEEAPVQVEEQQDALEVDQTATEPTKVEEPEQEPLKVEELEEKVPVESELEQKPAETEVFEAAKAEEGLEQVSETTAEEDRSSTEPQLATHSVTATDSSADSVDEPITPSIVVQNLEAVETSGKDEAEHTAEPATGEIERPKSPWTPSFTVTTLGGPVTETERDDAEDEPKPEQAAVSLLITDDDGKVQAPEESTPAPPARPWTPSYSVHAQGNSPVQTPTELEDEVPEAPLAKETETPSHVPSLDEVAEPQPAEVPTPTQPIVETTTNEEVPSEDVEVSTEQSARVGNADSPPALETASATEDTATVEKSTIEPIADTPPALNEVTEGSDEVAPVVPKEVDTETAAVDEEENKVESVSKGSEAEESTSAATPETDKAIRETPKPELVEETPAEEAAVPLAGESLSATAVDVVSPVPLAAPVPVVGTSSWVPSYSVSRQGSRQGSPVPRSQNIGEDDGAAAAKESVPASQVVEDTVHKDVPAISEPETNAISAPAGGQEVVARSWTPSYSVTTQGAVAEPDLSAAQDVTASSAVSGEPEARTASDIEEREGSGQQTTSETLKEAATNGAAAAVEDAEPESSSGVPPTDETPVITSASDPLETRKRIESTASSRFFPGSWFSAAKAPAPEEGRTSLETASGQFSRGPSSPLDAGSVLSPITINTENLAVPEGEQTEDSAVSPSKRKWCSIM